MPTIVMVLNTLAALCALYITYKAFMDSFKWGMFFLLTPVSFYILSKYTGELIAGVVVIGLQLYYVKNHWRDVGGAYVTMIVLWLCAQLLPRVITG